ncbi:hypothetical protein [Radiobacillus sp. PE A8.2]|uniref:hypothetical protein n=1 Tax=Radiobacillus sp. PE A8.2 TaxID=3380349 RepID=UPI00388F0F74
MITYDVISKKLAEVKPFDEGIICDQIEEIIAEFQLTITQRTTLSTKKGSYHWHVKRGKQKGVLEITFWPAKGRLWLDIAENRRAPWNIEIITVVAEKLAYAFQGKIDTSGDGIDKKR